MVYKWTAPAAHRQLKHIKQLFIDEHTHKTASLRVARLPTTLIKDFSQLFLITLLFSPPSEPRLRSWAVLEQDLGCLEQTQLNWAVQGEVTEVLQCTDKSILQDTSV